MRTGLMLLLMVASIVTRAGQSSAADPQSDVAAVLARSADAWNRGDIDAFMTSYENSPQTEYVGSKTVVHGYAAIRARYKAHYQPGHMGTLSISDLAVRPLGSDYALAVARWHVARPPANGGNLSGLFTLVLHRSASGWHIITDHTP